jgi:hypothetical protein
MFTPVWGMEYLEYMRRGLIKSLRQPLNAKAVKKTKWVIAYRQPVEKMKIDQMTQDICEDVHLVNLDIFQGIKYAMAMAHSHCVQLFLAMPDTVLSEGSIPNLRELGKQHDVCVAVPHVRVLPSFLDVRDLPLHPAEMVSHAWDNLHDSWTGSTGEEGMSRSRVGGIYWKKITPQLITVQHRLPTVFLANIKKSDIDFFNTRHHFGIWDHDWVQELMTQERVRIVGSSDVAFMAEVTKEGSNVPPEMKVNPDEPDAFFCRFYHNIINRMFVSVFRKAH